MHDERVVGHLYPWDDEGTEGVVWAIGYAGLPGQEALRFLQAGDRLCIYGEAGQVAWSGEVHLEFERRKRAHPNDPQRQQQEMHGMWVHGFQAGVDPGVWSEWFLKQAPAVLWRPMPPVEAVQAAAPAEFLDHLASDPEAAWAQLQGDQPRLTQALRAHLWDHWRYAHATMGWPAPERPRTPAEEANAWLHLVGLAQFQRHHWLDAYPTAQQRAWHQRLPEPWSLEDARHWAQQRLPHDRHPPKR